MARSGSGAANLMAARAMVCGKIIRATPSGGASEGDRNPASPQRRGRPQSACRLGKDHDGACSPIPTQEKTERTMLRSTSLLLNQAQHGLEAIIYENGLVRFIAVRPENGAYVPESAGFGAPHGYPVGAVMIDRLIEERQKLMKRVKASGTPPRPSGGVKLAKAKARRAAKNAEGRSP